MKTENITEKKQPEYRTFTQPLRKIEVSEILSPSNIDKFTRILELQDNAKLQETKIYYEDGYPVIRMMYSPTGDLKIYQEFAHTK